MARICKHANTNTSTPPACHASCPTKISTCVCTLYIGACLPRSGKSSTPPAPAPARSCLVHSIPEYIREGECSIRGPFSFCLLESSPKLSPPYNGARIGDKESGADIWHYRPVLVTIYMGGKTFRHRIFTTSTLPNELGRETYMLSDSGGPGLIQP